MANFLTKGKGIYNNKKPVADCHIMQISRNYIDK